MFTGIVEELGVVKRITPKAGVTCLEISAEVVLGDTKIGDSIAVNGVCLTVVAIRDNSVIFEVMGITFKNTNLGLLSLGGKVNLERSLKVGDRVGGHFVSGHVDCLGLVRKKSLRNGSVEFEISIPPAFSRFCLPQGSVALDGVSLTLAKTQGNVFNVCIIPHTLKNTILNLKGSADKMNVEFDMLVKRT